MTWPTRSASPNVPATGTVPAPRRVRIGICVECQSEDDCNSSKTCSSSSCVAKPDCTTDANCRAGQTCIESKCYYTGCHNNEGFFKRPCEADTECSLDRYCNEGSGELNTCAAGCAVGESCRGSTCYGVLYSEDSDCLHSVCVNGSCSSQCTANFDCASEQICSSGLRINECGVDGCDQQNR